MVAFLNVLNETYFQSATIARTNRIFIIWKSVRMVNWLLIPNSNKYFRIFLLLLQCRLSLSSSTPRQCIGNGYGWEDVESLIFWIKSLCFDRMQMCLIRCLSRRRVRTLCIQTKYDVDVSVCIALIVIMCLCRAPFFLVDTICSPLILI